MPRGPVKHQKRLSAPKHWLLDKLSGTYAPKPTAGPHKLRDCLPLVIFLRNRYVRTISLPMFVRDGSIIMRAPFN